jgi:hypothetical protein
VFSETPVPDGIMELPHVECGGTGFYYDQAPPLPPEVEHIMPDYHLYDEFVSIQIKEALVDVEDEKKREKILKRKQKELEYYTDYSIGFMTRGCIRGCSFCVNKNYKQCLKHSPVSEFLDEDRKYICCLDDNVLSCKDWKEIFEELNATGKRFQFKQGMDERLLTDEKCEVIFNSKWIGVYIFAFDNIKDRRLVEKKLQLIRQHTDKIPKFYCFCGYNHELPDTYSIEFWMKDIEDLLERIKILMSYHALPYVMRYADYVKSPYKTLYNSIAAWCNQPSFFKKTSFREYCVKSYKLNRKSLLRSLEQFEADCPDVVKRYFDLKWDDYNK